MTISANLFTLPDPAQSIICNPSFAVSSLVPPPIVAIGKSGIFTEKYKSPSLSSAVVIPKEPSTTCASS